jgi:RimJ/RimL family protein N-acetyltransferase
MSEVDAIYRKSFELRSEYRFTEAYNFISNITYRNLISSLFIWAHQPILWSDITAGVCKLTRRKQEDAEFIAYLWKNKNFVYQFHRQSQDLTGDLELLKLTLDKEYTSTITELNQLHWIVRDKSGKPYGLLSLTNISLDNKSAEVLLGVESNAPIGLATAAMLILFQFFFKAMGFNKLYSFVYEDNPHSLKGTLHLGFKREGLLREHVIDPKSNKYVNLIQTGLLASEVDSISNQRLMNRLLS